MSDPGVPARLRDLLERLEAARARLEGSEDSEAAVEILQELSDLAKETQAAIETAKRAGPGGSAV